MSRVDELIAKLAPQGVQFKKLGDVAQIAGRNVQPSAMGDAPVTIFSLPSFDHGMTPEVLTGTEVGSAKTRLSKPVVLAAKLNPHIPRVWRLEVIPERAFCSPEFYPIEPDATSLEIGFLYYLILSKMSWLAGTVTGSTNSHKRLQREDYLNLEVPVPPLEVQREIVRILDQFTQLEAELEAELEARRCQYDYYAAQLLSVDGDVPRVKFGDIARIVRGASPRPIQKFLTDDPRGVPWIKIGDVPAGGKYITGTAQKVTPEGAAKSRRVTPGDFVLSNSMSFGRPYVSKIEGYIHDGWLAISDFEDSYVRDYLYYLLRSGPVQDEFARKAGAGTVKNLNAEIVRSVVIPMPPREQQERVVDLLDRFDALVNDISVGLPAELHARRTQYEHYRDRLLTFKEAK
ncbi:restriction endonuclease subunit S [Aeromicrobium sp. PE09-221]|uniref:restriction endonuclease subunit S n=1 Tax=Aeromicrobium sp. PE09-221 TaxID=1898043 RepID=UPI000B3ECD67|nr:restriction endonuclease subunit S [Aeromicrobium sp. PE09-221]OUZ08156.1 restriction endonuclease subunit S [Aeromicrobium sp. PE09-221]